MQIYGYHRTSTKEQHLDRGIQEIERYCNEHEMALTNIFTDQETGKNFNRPRYTVLVEDVLRPGDILIVTELDRLGRNKYDTMQQIQRIKNMGVRLMVLELPTTLMDLSVMDNAMARMMLETINNMMLELYASMAQAELEKKEKRQREGIEAKKLRGEWDDYGRPSVMKQETFDENFQSVVSGETTPTQLRKNLREAGVTYKVYKNTLVNRAIEGTEFESLKDVLEGPNAFAVSTEDATAPARVLADGIIGQMMEKVVLPPFHTRRTEEEIIAECPWATQGKTAGRKPNVITSLELDPAKMEENNIRFQAKYRKIEENEVRYEEFQCEDAEYLLIAFGSSARICQKVVEIARAEGIKLGLLRPITLWPFPTKAIAAYAEKVKGMLSVELNAGQMVEDVRLAVNGKVKVEHFGRLGGIVFTPDEVLNALKKNFEL